MVYYASLIESTTLLMFGCIIANTLQLSGIYASGTLTLRRVAASAKAEVKISSSMKCEVQTID
jgi:hypothetical protein